MTVTVPPPFIMLLDVGTERVPIPVAAEIVTLVGTEPVMTLVGVAVTVIGTDKAGRRRRYCGDCEAGGRAFVYVLISFDVDAWHHHAQLGACLDLPQIFGGASPVHPIHNTHHEVVRVQFGIPALNFLRFCRSHRCQRWAVHLCQGRIAGKRDGRGPSFSASASPSAQCCRQPFTQLSGTRPTLLPLRGMVLMLTLTLLCSETM